MGNSVEEMRFPIFPYFTRYSSTIDVRAGGTRDEALRRSAWEAMIVILDRCKGGSPGVVITNIRGGGLDCVV